MSKTLTGNLDKQKRSAGLSSALVSSWDLDLLLAVGQGCEVGGRTMWLSSALLLLSFPGMFS